MNQETRCLLQSSLVASLLCLLSACSGGPAPKSQEESELSQTQTWDLYQRAEIQYTQGKAEEALTLLDRAMDGSDTLSRMQRGKLNLLAGEANLTFAEKAAAQGRGAVVIQGSYVDAENRLRDAARLMPEDEHPWVLLSRTLYKMGKWDEMRTAAEKAGEVIAAHGQQLSPSQIKMRASVLGYEGYAYLRECIAERQAELKDDPKAKVGEKTYAYASQALMRFKRSIEMDPEQELVYSWMANGEEWINRPLDAIAVLELSIKNNPRNAAHHQRLQSLYRRYNRLDELVSVYKKLSETSKTAKDYYDYYLGLAWQMKADAARKRGDNEKALESYGEAQAAFAGSARHNPAFKSNCDLARAICEVSKAAMSLEDGEEDRAWEELTSAWNMSHRIAEIDPRGYDRYFDSFKKSYRALCYQLGQRYMESRLPEAVRFWRDLTSRHSTWGDAWNNLGFALRDHGSLLAKNGDPKAAMAEWEESFKAYQQAMRYQPEDERIVNDTGLMLVYHLKRNYDEAEQLFKKAIELGDAKLADMDDDAPDIKANVRTARRDIEEAVGDAWQNLGVLYKRLGKDAESRKAYEQAVRYWSPSLRMQIRAMLRKMGQDKTREWVAPLPAPTAPILILVPPRGRFDTVEALPEDEIETIQRLLDTGKAEAALDLCEKALDKDTENVELLYLAGRGSLLFARQTMRAGRRGGESNLIDAVSRFEAADRATRKQSQGSEHFGNSIHILPVLYLMEARIAQGEPRAAMDAGKTHRTHLMGVTLEFDPALMARFRATLGEATLRAATQGKEKDRAALLASAKLDMVEAHKGLEKLAHEKGALGPKIQKGAGKDWDPQKLYLVWKDIELWRGKPAAAIQALGKGAETLAGPARLKLVNQMVEMVTKRGSANTALRVLDHLVENSKGDATLIWYRGRTHFLRAIELRRNQKNKAALTEVRLSRADFEQSIHKNPGFKSSTAIWLAYTWLAEGALICQDEDWDAAGNALVQSLAASPQAAEASDFSGWTTRKYLEFVGGKYYRARRYADAIALFDAALEHLAGDPKFLSNKALMLRDWGNILSRRDPKKSKELFEQSYAAYKLALKRAHNDVRIMNDAALMDVFYLHTEPDATRRLLERAIKTGDRLLLTNKGKKGFDAPFVEEATGDACMNLGKLLLEHYKDLDGSERVLRQGLKHKRASQQDIRRLLQRVEAARAAQDEGTEESPKKEPVKK